MSFPVPLPFTFPGEDDAGGGTASGGTTAPAAPYAVIDHTAAALNRLAQYLRDKNNVTGILTAMGGQAQQVETAFQQLLLERWASTAFGAELDNLGRIVGQPRNGLTGDLYRLWISARVAINRASGTVPEILKIFSYIIDAGVTMVIEDQPPVMFTLVMNGTPLTVDNAPELAAILQSVKAAGVRALMTFGISPEANTFSFDGAGPGFDVGHFRETLE